MKKLIVLLLSAFLFTACNDYSILLNPDDSFVEQRPVYYCSSLSEVEKVVTEKTHIKIDWKNFKNKESQMSIDSVYTQFPLIYKDSYLKTANWDTWQDGYYVKISKTSTENLTIFYLKFDQRIPVTKGNNYLKQYKVYLW
ncbi:MAG: hypothetical protein J5687_05265 [Treponema sp.]|nr:hypothetical protein [Treponema sp.]